MFERPKVCSGQVYTFSDHIFRHFWERLSEGGLHVIDPSLHIFVKLGEGFKDDELRSLASCRWRPEKNPSLMRQLIACSTCLICRSRRSRALASETFQVLVDSLHIEVGLNLSVCSCSTNSKCVVRPFGREGDVTNNLVYITDAAVAVFCHAEAFFRLAQANRASRVPPRRIPRHIYPTLRPNRGANVLGFQ